MPRVVQLRSCGGKPLKRQKSLKRAFICAFSRIQVYSFYYSISFCWFYVVTSHINTVPIYTLKCQNSQPSPWRSALRTLRPPIQALQALPWFFHGLDTAGDEWKICEKHLREILGNIYIYIFRVCFFSFFVFWTFGSDKSKPDAGAHGFLSAKIARCRHYLCDPSSWKCLGSCCHALSTGVAGWWFGASPISTPLKKHTGNWRLCKKKHKSQDVFSGTTYLHIYIYI